MSHHGQYHKTCQSKVKKLPNTKFTVKGIAKYFQNMAKVLKFLVMVKMRKLPAVQSLNWMKKIMFNFISHVIWFLVLTYGLVPGWAAASWRRNPWRPWQRRSPRCPARQCQRCDPRQTFGRADQREPDFPAPDRALPRQDLPFRWRRWPSSGRPELDRQLRLGNHREWLVS